MIIKQLMKRAARLWAVALIMLLPVMLTGCGGAGKGNALENASLAPPPNLSPGQAKQAVAHEALSASKPEQLGTTPTTTPNDVVIAKLTPPPMPVKRPHRKIKRQRNKVKARPKTPKASPTLQKVKLERSVAMVPEKVISVQVVPSGVPQDIVDAFNEEPEEAKAVPEKVAKASPVPNDHSFGQAEHNFSGR